MKRFLHFTFEGLRIAFSAITSNKLRAFLTMLGVATGIFAITSVLTMVSSMRNSVEQNLSELGSTTFFVYNWPWVDEGKDWREYLARPKVNFQEYTKLVNHFETSEIEGISYRVSSNARSVRAKGQSISNVTVHGVTQNADIVTNFEFDEGRYISTAEFQYGASVCIIGHEIKTNLFPDNPAEGKFIRIGGKQLRVVGVLKRVGEAMFAETDDEIFVPYQVAPQIFNVKRRWVDKMITVKAANDELLPFVESETIGIIRAARQLKPKDENNFSINKPEQIMAEVDKIMGFLKTGGWVISAFSIIIGVFSIGMIMYISVRERTNEIGVQKALGSTRGFILYQFLSESAIICLFGGMIGLFFVWLTTLGVQFAIDQAGWPLQIGLDSGNILLAMGLSLVIGILAGIIPASIASALDPVKAIRHT